MRDAVMRDDLLLYYDRELQFLRHMGADFAAKYPKIASRLILDEAGRSEDPHVERLLEGFAFLAARVHLKIDDEFPEITEALLSILYPHYIRPIPSMSIVQFHLDPEQGKSPHGVKIDAGSMMNSRPVGGVPCKFRTCYQTTLWPVSVVEAEWKTPDRLQPPIKAPDADAALRLRLECMPDMELSKLNMNSLRLYLDGASEVIHALYELLLSNCLQVWIRDPENPRLRPVQLPPAAVQAVGFGEDEGMLPYPKRSFIGYRLLQEYFTFPEKFFFIDLNRLEGIWANGFNRTAELVFLIGPYDQNTRKQMLELGITSKTFRLGCTPIINLFPQTAEPILLDQRRFEYPIIPDVRRPNALEIFSVDEVVSIDPHTHETLAFEPFYSYRHATIRERKQTFWLANRRRSSRRNDEGTEMTISLVDLSSRPISPDTDNLTIRTTCTNRDLPARLPFGNENGDFELDVSMPVKRIVALRKPTQTQRPPTGGSVFWRLISHLSLNYLSLVEDGKEGLQEILKLYNFDFSNQLRAEQQIDGIVSVRSARHFARVISENGISFARGVKVELELDEEQFVGGGVYLFASIIERFLALYVTLNSFSQLVMKSRQRKEVIREWPPRAGQKILI
jgi:type VI secretion system protein ImpG